MPKQTTNYSWNGLAVGDRVAYQADGASETAVIISLTDPKVGTGTGTVYDITVRVLTSTNRRAVGREFSMASHECRRI